MTNDPLDIDWSRYNQLVMGCGAVLMIVSMYAGIIFTRGWFSELPGADVGLIYLFGWAFGLFGWAILLHVASKYTKEDLDVNDL